MRIILVHNHYDNKHLEEVKQEMVTLGAPTIKAAYVECYDAYIALEGCHRIRAAKELGLEIEIEELDVEEIFEMQISDLVDGFDGECSFEELLDGCERRDCIEF